MNLYLISQDVNNGYDTFDSAVVAAVDEEGARNTHPQHNRGPNDDTQWGDSFSGWAKTPEQVKVELLGVAVEGTQAGCICSSYNAG